MSETMKMTAEEMEKRLKMVESMCICKGCPTYKALDKEDNYIAYCFPTRGKSKNVSEEKGCTSARARDIPNPRDPPSDNWNEKADLNDDQMVSIQDLFQVAKDFGKTVMKLIACLSTSFKLPLMYST